MNRPRFVLATVGVALALCLATVSLWAQGGRGFGQGPPRRGGGPDAQFPADREVFQYLLSHHDDIRRSVTNRDDGVETLTESDDPQVTAKIQQHVAAMYRRVEEDRPIRRRDPLFNELFRHADAIEMEMEKTDKGIKVTETSADPQVVRLLQEHAKVVSSFVRNGHAEARKSHAVPPSAPTRPTTAPPATTP
ncbi:MAG: hypothetical protein R3C10_01045 [Pirellulales bacterium]